MKAISITERIVYLLVILLSLAILVLVLISPAGFLSIDSVYQGF